MKTVVALVITAGFVVAPYLGIGAMHNNETMLARSSHPSCVVSAVARIPCPSAGNMFEYISFHLGAIRTLLTSDGAIVFGFLALGAAWVCAIKLLGAHLHILEYRVARYHHIRLRSLMLPFIKRFLSWLGLQFQLGHAAARI